MDLLDRGARIGTAGFVLSRLLLEPPSLMLAENFASPQMRDTWPLRDEHSTAALASLAPDPYETLPRDHATLFRRRPPRVALHESAWLTADPAALRADLTAAYRGANFTSLPAPVDDNVGYQLAYLADLATRVGRAAGGGDVPTAREAAAAAARFREQHTDRFIGPVLDGVEQHARTHLYRAVPGLVRGFLAAHAELCTAATDLRETRARH